MLRALEEYIVAAARGSVLASQGPTHKKRVRVVAIQLQYTIGQLSVKIQLEIRCPLDMSRGQRISNRISTEIRLYSIHNYRRYFIQEEPRQKGGATCALGVASPPNKFDNGTHCVTPYLPYSCETVYMHTFIPVVYGKFA